MTAKADAAYLDPGSFTFSHHSPPSATTPAHSQPSSMIKQMPGEGWACGSAHMLYHCTRLHQYLKTSVYVIENRYDSHGPNLRGDGFTPARLRRRPPELAARCLSATGTLSGATVPHRSAMQHRP